jgi:hypothetical protein
LIEIAQPLTIIAGAANVTGGILACPPSEGRVCVAQIFRHLIGRIAKGLEQAHIVFVN